MSTGSNDSDSDTISTAREEEQVYGERLLDDLMNVYCDKLQKSALESKRLFDGLLAIQYITKVRQPSFWEWLCCKRLDVDSVRRMITGRHPVMQVIFDSERMHYVVLYRSLRRNVILYDSLHSHDLDDMLTETVKQQILTMFGHLYHGGEVIVEIELNYERQEDAWSCGYRAVACCTTLALGENPVRHSYDLQAIYRLLVSVLNIANPQWELFKTTTISMTSVERKQSKIWQVVQNTWSLTASLLTKRGREENESRVRLLLRPDLSYTVLDGEQLLTKKNNTSRSDSTKTARTPATSEEDLHS